MSVPSVLNTTGRTVECHISDAQSLSSAKGSPKPSHRDADGVNCVTVVRGRHFCIDWVNLSWIFKLHSKRTNTSRRYTSKHLFFLQAQHCQTTTRPLSRTFHPYLIYYFSDFTANSDTLNTRKFPVETIAEPYRNSMLCLPTGGDQGSEHETPPTTNSSLKLEDPDNLKQTSAFVSGRLGTKKQAKNQNTHTLLNTKRTNIFATNFMFTQHACPLHAASSLKQ